jgi:hypothetical protein
VADRAEQFFSSGCPFLLRIRTGVQWCMETPIFGSGTKDRPTPDQSGADAAPKINQISTDVWRRQNQPKLKPERIAKGLDPWLIVTRENPRRATNWKVCVSAPFRELVPSSLALVRELEFACGITGSGQWLSVLATSRTELRSNS